MNIALAIIVALAGLAPQEGVEVRFHRVYLRNGNFVDGELVKQDPKEVHLKIRSGEMIIRADQIDRIEFVKMRGAFDKPVAVELKKAEPAPAERRDPMAKPQVAVKAEVSPAFAANPETKRKVDALLAELARSNPEAKLALLDQLGAVGDDAGPYLASLLDKVDRADISIVTAAVVKNKDLRSVPVLAVLTTHADALVRTAAASALGGLGSDTAIPSLLPLLKDKDPVVKATAIGSLQEMADRRTFDAVLEILSDTDREVRTRAIQAAGAMAAKLGLSAEYVDGIIRALDAAKPQAKFDLLSALSQTKSRTKWAVVAAYLRDDMPELRAMAANSLSALGATEAGDALTAQALVESDDRVRTQIAGAARLVGAKGTIPALIRWLREPNEQLRKESLTSLEVLTGQKFGADVERWEAWAAENKK